MESKYSKVLTIILIVIVIAIVVLLGIFGYDLYKKSSNDKKAETIVDEFQEYYGDGNGDGDGIRTNDPDSDDSNVVVPIINDVSQGENTQSTTVKKKPTYKGYNVIGTIEIPKISLKYPILERVTKDAIETSVAVLQPSAGPNVVGNTTIVGHNYRNGSFFGSNDKLAKGDKIFITDTSGQRIKYNIYNIYTTAPDDAEYMTRDTKGKREISLSTCTDNSKSRLVIWAVED